MLEWSRERVSGALCVGLVVAAGCAPQPGEPLRRHGDEIVAAGQLFHTGTPVVLWFDPGGYDAYRGRRHFTPSEIMPSNPVSPGNPNRYGQRRGLPEELEARVEREGWTLENLQDMVDQFVIHYDACGTSRRCFEILHDVRGLSVQFMLDVDGTIYQTLDLKERAWHAGRANDRSVGIEIANIGAYPNTETLDMWYGKDESGWPMVTYPDWMEETGIRTPDFVARPARREPIEGTINGSYRIQYDYTDAQYEALIKLTATLVKILPKLELQVPRTESGEVRTDAFSREELAAFSGILGHQNVTTAKSDPGPAFDWERLLNGVQRELYWW